LAVSSLMPSATAISLFRIPLRNQPYHIDLPRRQGGLRLARLEEAPRWTASAGRRRDVADHANEILGQRVFQQIGRRPGFERLTDVLVAVVHRQHDDSGVRRLAADLLDRFDPLMVGSWRSIRGDIRTQLPEKSSTDCSPFVADPTTSMSPCRSISSDNPSRTTR
jgi:hypothetical protein